ncbi:lytic transglycosylase domain-containing protein [Bdellovibrio sp.]|uniref:lytic transglycosylase domain-containing protein n=1 Tax=Bdellovibrio sp. TaxID=28201 RepID=UPI0039E321A0
MKKLSVSILYTVLLGVPTVGLAQDDIAAKVVPQILGRSPEEVRPWRAPAFSEQSSALGYSSGSAFSIPKGMEKQVQFWVDIYTKYSSEEGVIHDSEKVEVVYEVVDLKGLKTEREKQKKIDEVKKTIAEKLSTPEEKERLRFQLGQKDKMQDAIFYSGRYLEDMEKIFREANLPIELTRLAFVESSFNIMARSKVGASGIWQIMPYTARPYKMISPVVDKRNHPIEATKLAARLLRNNYSMLESWPLAVTGYNHGPTGVLKMTRDYETRELGELIQNVRSRKSFGFASRNFYASFLAAIEVEKNAGKYFESVVWSKPLNSQDLKLPVAIKYKDIVSWFDGDDRKAQIFNPHLTLKARQGHLIPAKTIIAVPKDKYNVALISLARKDRTVAMEDKKGR